jgi:hypothetical protein
MLSDASQTATILELFCIEVHACRLIYHYVRSIRGLLCSVVLTGVWPHCKFRQLSFLVLVGKLVTCYLRVAFVPCKSKAIKLNFGFIVLLLSFLLFKLIVNGGGFIK